MKRGDEALNASSLLFLRSVKRFIALFATIFYVRLGNTEKYISGNQNITALIEFP
jgi:hypothetical protein